MSSYSSTLMYDIVSYKSPGQVRKDNFPERSVEKFERHKRF